MSTKVEVDPARVNCPSCMARPGEPCIALVLSETPPRLRPEEPLRKLSRCHDSRKLTAKHGRI